MEKENEPIVQENKPENISEVKEASSDKKKWFKDPYNITLLVIVGFAFIIRIYYFILTQNQAVWWDEADYMAIAKAIAFGYDYSINVVRPIFFPLIISFFLKLGDQEVLIRTLLLVLSIVSVTSLYFLGKEMFNKKIGLISAFLMSIFYLNLFYTNRILVDLPSLALFTLSAFFFYKYFKTKSSKALYIASVIIGIGTLIKLTTANLLFIVLIYALFTEKLNLFKRKEFYIAALIFILILSPYVIWGYGEYHTFVITAAGSYNAPKTDFIGNFFTNLFASFANFPIYLSIPLLIVFILGLFIFYKLILGFDVLLKKDDFEVKRLFFLILLLIIPIITVSASLIYPGFIDDRYLLTMFPAIYIISSAFLIFIYDYLAKMKLAAIGIIILILVLGGITYFQIQSADSLIKQKLHSYEQIKDAGLWIKQNSEPNDSVISSSLPQMTYYSDRKVYSFLDNQSAFEEEMKKVRPVYFTASLFEKAPNWSYSFPQEKNLTPVMGYYLDPEQKQLAIVIYKYY